MPGFQGDGFAFWYCEDGPMGGRVLRGRVEECWAFRGLKSLELRLSMVIPFSIIFLTIIVCRQQALSNWRVLMLLPSLQHFFDRQTSSRPCGTCRKDLDTTTASTVTQLRPNPSGSSDNDEENASDLLASASSKHSHNQFELVAGTWRLGCQKPIWLGQGEERAFASA